MNYIIVNRGIASIKIHVELDGISLESIRYIGYTGNDVKKAIREYRREHNLKYKHLIRIDI